MELAWEMYPSYSSYVVLSELSLPIAKILPAHGQNGRLTTCLGTEGPQSDALQRFGSHGINFVCHLRDRNLAIMDQQLCKAPSAPLWLNNTLCAPGDRGPQPRQSGFQEPSRGCS